MAGETSTARPQLSWRPEHHVREENVALRRAVTELDHWSGRILEAGCGAGRFIRAIVGHRPAFRGYGCDVDAVSLATARELGGDVCYTLGDLTALPFADEEFDVVLLFDVLEHLHDPQQGLREVRRVLRSGGLLHAVVPCEGQPFTLHWLLWKLNAAADLKERQVGHVQRFTHRQLRAVLSQEGFELRKTTYSMHPLGQVKDILMYLEREENAPQLLFHSPLYRLVTLGLWGAAHLESLLLARVPLSAVALHVTVSKP